MIELYDAALWTIVICSFCASAFNAAFGFGGAFILTGGMTFVLPMSAILPLQSSIMVASQITRGWALRSHVDWKFVRSFAMGAPIGAFAGAQLYLNMPQQLVAAILAGVMFWAAWGPKKTSPVNIPHSEILIGGVHTFMSTAFSFGGLMQATLFRRPWPRTEIAATIAFCALAMNVFKFPAYATSGFDYKPFLTYLVSAWLIAPLGTWVGRHLLYKMSEQVFRTGFKVILNVVGLRLVWVAIAPLFTE